LEWLEKVTSAWCHRAAQQLRHGRLGKNFGGGKVMKRLGFVLTPMVTAADILALAGVAMAQRDGDAMGRIGGMSHELVASEPLCSASTDACWQRDRRVDVGFRTGN
jgi:hypothetical protein